MTAATFSWFAVVQALVSISEARLGRPKSAYVAGSPTVFYQATTASRIAEEVNKDLNTGYRVAFELTDLELRNMTTEFLRLLPTIPMKLLHPTQNIRIPDFIITELQVTARVFPVLLAEARHGKGSNKLDLTIIIPSVRTNVSSNNCQLPAGPRFSCNTVYVFSSIQLRILLSIKPRDLSIVSASIVKSEPGGINYQVFYGSHSLPYQKLRKGSVAWTDFMAKVKAIIPNNSHVQRLVTNFAQRIIS